MFKVIVRKRSFINSSTVNPYLYQFEGLVSMDLLDYIPSKFLEIPQTGYYEYGGTHEEALQELTNAGFHDIIEGNEL